jgi:hypothetical protein
MSDESDRSTGDVPTFVRVSCRRGRARGVLAAIKDWGDGRTVVVRIRYEDGGEDVVVCDCPPRRRATRRRGYQSRGEAV